MSDIHDVLTTVTAWKRCGPIGIDLVDSPSAWLWSRGTAPVRVAKVHAGSVLQGQLDVGDEVLEVNESVARSAAEASRLINEAEGELLLVRRKRNGPHHDDAAPIRLLRVSWMWCLLLALIALAMYQRLSVHRASKAAELSTTRAHALASQGAAIAKMKQQSESALTLQLTESQSTIKMLTQRAETYHGFLRSSEEAASMLNASVQQSKAELTTVRLMLDRAKQQYEHALALQATQLHSTIAGLRQEADSLRGMWRRSEEKTSNLNASLREIRVEESTLRDYWRASKQKLRASSEELDALKASNQSLSVWAAAARKQMEDVHTHLSQTRSNFRLATARESRMRHQLRWQIAAMRAELAQIDNETGGLSSLEAEHKKHGAFRARMPTRAPLRSISSSSSSLLPWHRQIVERQQQQMSHPLNMTNKTLQKYRSGHCAALKGTVRSEGVVVYLAQARHSSYGRDSLKLLRDSVRHLATNYLNEHCDDVMFMHFGEVNEASQAQVLQLAGEVHARFYLLDEQYRTTPLGTPPESQWKMRQKFSAGYRHMIRLFTIGLWQVIAREGYEYVMRLDEDSTILSRVPYNIFSFMRTANLDYTFRLAAWENGGFKFNVHRFVRDYLVDKKLQPVWLLDTCLNQSAAAFDEENCGPLYGFYNNWFATRLSFWLRPDVQAFLKYVDDSHVIYTRRAGDLLWQSVAVQTFMSRERVRMLRSFSYAHATYAEVETGIVGKVKPCVWYGGVALGDVKANYSAAWQQLSEVSVRPLKLELTLHSQSQQ